MRYLIVVGLLGVVIAGHGLWQERSTSLRLMLRAYSTALYAIGVAAGHVVRVAVLSAIWSAHAVTLGFDDVIGAQQPAEPDDGSLTGRPTPPRRIRNG